MKLNARDALAFFQRPDPAGMGALIAGEDQVRVAERRRQVLSALLGPNAEAEMRLTRIPAADLRKDGAMLLDALKAIGFFPGPRAVLLEDATDGLSAVIGKAMKEWQAGDAQLIITAGALTARSSLRKLAEGAPRFAAVVLYDDPPSPDEVMQMLATAGLTQVADDGRVAILSLSKLLDPGDLRQTIEKLSLFKMGDAAPVSAADIAANAPQSHEADTDSLIATVALGRRGEIAGQMRLLYAQGVQPVGLCIATLRHFRQLHAAMTHPGGVAEGLSSAQPPVFGPRRDAIIAQSRGWTTDRVEGALQTILETDLRLRSANPPPQGPLVERMLLRLASIAKAQSSRGQDNNRR
ncbi:DNA polymerase III subunit delta [Ketogulonicigenium robustum]|uniref:DNA-directed DNA polymerase n=1 Tax=Ketogulonicigenium robustum TaxID=92947 RepID=A0A1W6P2Y9_9RHOB|nr:DNA polymerase III subunit delta [Ketogulonicigenium robustum]ARO15751.1 DNA polymerase III subunit delta [Ketogulonicigenium robustum]